MNTLGQRIRELRLKKGITQIDLSKGICTPSMVSQIESDRARPSYKILFGIADRLDVPLEKLLTDVDLNLEYVSTYKMSRAMVAAKEYASAIPLLLELIDAPRAQISSMDIMHDLAECYLYTGQYEEADRVLTQVQELALLRQDHQLLALVMKNVGLIDYHRKRYQLAAYQWHKALEELGKMEEEDLFLRACILFNLGLANTKLGQILDALEYYNQASALYEGADNLYEIGKVYMGLGASYKRINDLEKAAHYSDRATAIFEGLNNAHMTVKLKMTSAVLLAKTGRLDEAVDHFHKVIAKLHELGHKEDEGIASVELAKLHLQRGDMNLAEECCMQGRSLLPEPHVFQGWVHRVMGQIAHRRGLREEAIRRYQRAADIFKRMEEVGEWDGTMYELARLYLEENDYSRAYAILDDIRRYSQQILEERGIVL